MSFAVLWAWWFFLSCNAVVAGSNISSPQNATRSANSTSSRVSSSSPTTSYISIYGNLTLSRNATTAFSSSGNLPTSGVSSLDSILSCDSQLAAYSLSSILAYSSISETTFTKVYVSTSTVYETTYTCSSTCGNVCYADVTTTASVVSTTTGTITDTSTDWATYTGQRPSCTVPESSCSSIWSVWSASTSVWMNWYNTMGPSDQEPSWPYATPGCEWCSRTQCYIQGSGNLEVYYWPEPTTVSRNMCTDFPSQGYSDPWTDSATYTKYTEVTTGPSVVMDGRTFYQGNVYLSVPAASVTDDCGSTLGSVHSNILLTLAPTDIVTARNDVLGKYPIDYADFNTPVPWSAYRGALQDCLTGMNIQMGPWCTRSVVFQDQYHPILELPVQMQFVDPAWVGCRPIDALVDPPIALSSADIFSTTSAKFLPTQPASVTYVNTAANPASSHASVAVETGASLGNGDGEENNAGTGPTPTGAASHASGQGATVSLTTIGTTIIAADPSGGNVIIDPRTTISRGSAATVSGTTISIGKNSITMWSPAGSTTLPIIAGESLRVAVGSQEWILNSEGNLAAAMTTLSKGTTPVMVAGSVVIVGGNALTVMDRNGGTIKTVSYSGPGLAPQLMTVGDQVLTIKPNGVVILASGTTLHVGDPAVTISGTTISLGQNGMTIVDGEGQSTVEGWQDGNVTTVPGGEAEATGGQILSGQHRSAIASASGSAVVTASKKGESSALGPHCGQLILGLCIWMAYSISA